MDEIDSELMVVLGRKRDALTLRLAALADEAEAVRQALRQIDVTLRMLSPQGAHEMKAEPRPGAGGASAARYFARGECLALTKAILAEAGGPMALMEICDLIIARKGLPVEARESIRQTVYRNLVKGGSSEGFRAVDDDGGRFPRWTLASPGVQTGV